MPVNKTSRRDFLKLAAGSAAVLAVPGRAVAEQTHAPQPRGESAEKPNMNSRPNVLLIHWHDLGRYLGAYGRDGVESPHLDKLAAEGVSFDNAFCAAPLCTPARGSLFTGLHPHRNGLMGLHIDGWRYRPGIRTLPEILAGHGYETALIGLQHEHPNSAYVGFQRAISAPRNQFCDDVVPLAAEYLASRVGNDHPFFATVGFFEPHRPPGGGDFTEETPLPPDGNAPVPVHLPDLPEIRRDAAGYYGSIKRTDAATGRILQALEDSGLAENTIVIFTTDHGSPFPGAKGTLYEAGLETAFLWKAPGMLPQGKRYPALFSHVDFVPTLLDSLGCPVPEGLDGQSHWQAMLGDGEPPHPMVFGSKTTHNNYDPQRSVRDERFKYIRRYQPRDPFALARDIVTSSTSKALTATNALWFADAPEEQLYDLQADPHERTNLAEDPAHRGTLDRLRGQLEAWQRETGDPLLHGPVPLPASGRS